MTMVTEGTQEPVLRTLSVAGLCLLVVNGMIGAGIFGLPAEAARLAGAFSPWIFAICGVLQLPVMLCFARLARYFTGTGGSILYVGTAFGPISGFQAGWCLYVARVLAFAANINLLVDSLAYLAGGTFGSASRVWMLFVVCGFLGLVNAAGVRGAIRWLGALTFLKFAPLIVLLLFGALEARIHLPLEAAPQLGDAAAAALVVMYVYAGFESAPVVAGEARDPQRDIPRALMLGLAVCVGLYVMVQAVAVAALPALASSSRPLVDAAEVLMGASGALALAAAAVASIAANLFGNMLSTSRITYRLALEGQLPRWFAWVHPVYRTPAWSIAFFAAACFLLSATGGFVWLASLSVLTRLVLWLACVAALPPLSRRFDPADRTEGSLGAYLLPVLAAAVCIALLCQVKLRAYVSVAGLLAVGSLLYLVARRTWAEPRAH